ncbi:hypothetical protein JTE90_014294 [Oedothorax gibbosus]|uniref:Lipocalin/cytosolic fatty-acid binding domain-containing protein n=1 Tax=Oedothorax gibbosus TaxID=931172 RepID=A0AAV6UI36_9ARAC|nr:hypothetical protein JTE90_014294 [Oedothorax gibbosus]
MWAQVILVLGLSATALSAGFGSCPEPKVQKDFDLEKFAGTWYLIEATANPEMLVRKCSQYLVEKKSANKASLLHKFISTISQKSKSEFYEFTTDKKEPGKLEVSPLKGIISTLKFPVRVLDTDYDTYAILYSCKKLFLAYVEEVFIVARAKTLDDTKKTELYSILKKKDVSQKALKEVSQSDKDCKENES